MTRFSDDEKINKFLADTLPKFEEIATRAGENKWLWETDEVTYLDFYIGSAWEFLYVFKDAPAFADGF